MSSLKEYRQNYLGMCQQSPCCLETTVLCISHKITLWSIWAILMHSEWKLDVKIEPNFIKVSLDVIDSIKKDLKGLFNNFKEINYIDPHYKDAYEQLLHNIDDPKENLNKDIDIHDLKEEVNRLKDLMSTIKSSQAYHSYVFFSNSLNLAK